MLPPRAETKASSVAEGRHEEGRRHLMKLLTFTSQTLSTDQWVVGSHNASRRTEHRGTKSQNTHTHLSLSFLLPKLGRTYLTHNTRSRPDRFRRAYAVSMELLGVPRGCDGHRRLSQNSRRRAATRPSSAVRPAGSRCSANIATALTAVARPSTTSMPEAITLGVARMDLAMYRSPQMWRDPKQRSNKLSRQVATAHRADSAAGAIAVASEGAPR